MPSTAPVVDTPLADQIMTVSKERLTGRIAALSEHEMRDINKAIRIQLGLAN